MTLLPNLGLQLGLRKVADGHDFSQLLPVLQKNTSTDRPRSVLLHTVRQRHH